MPKSTIFVSYRRDDSAGFAGRLFDRLSQRFGSEQVFMDIDTIEPGVDFVEVIEKAVGSCDVLIAVIGKQWMTVTDAQGQRRLANPHDFVRLEIGTALRRRIRVIPVLVGGATVPRAQDLPDDLAPLARRNALEISHERFHYDAGRLIEAIQKVVGAVETAEPGSTPSSPPRRQPFEPEMILIPAGEFLMGSDAGKDAAADDDEKPQHRLYLPDYAIAQTPTTVAQFEAFVQATDHQPTTETVGGGWVWDGKEWKQIKGADWRHPRGPQSDVREKAQHPVTQVSWHDAVAYCRWLSKVTGRSYRLPSEAEWEKGARGTDGRIYPWGDEAPDDQRCNFNSNVGDTTPVGKYRKGVSPYGLLDMAGNVWEWTGSLWGSDAKKPDFKYPYDANDGRENLAAPDSVYRVLRGGSWNSDQDYARCAARHWSFPFGSGSYGGFRVVSPIGSGS
jgi:formylglycine-generating enzyme required for sulfatase activity